MAEIEENIAFFAGALEERSREHRRALILAMENKWWSIVGSILRMELDSLIRVTYLREHPDQRESILDACVTGLGFGTPRRTGTGIVRIPDAAMVPKGGWEERVYDFGNRFVHLTEAHNYTECDPFKSLPEQDRTAIIEYLHQYHQGKPGVKPLSLDSPLDDVALYAPHVLTKIADNARCGVEALEREISSGRN